MLKTLSNINFPAINNGGEVSIRCNLPKERIYKELIISFYLTVVLSMLRTFPRKTVRVSALFLAIPFLSILAITYLSILLWGSMVKVTPT